MSQCVVISGLAGGMGREAALELARRVKGVKIAGFDMDADGLASLGTELDGLGAVHHLVTLDIRDRDGVRAFRDDVLAEFGHVDTVVSNVGVPFFGVFEEVDLDRALVAFEINVIGAATLFQSFIPSMRERRAGKLVAVASLVGRIPFPFESIYSSTKFAVEGLVQSLKFEVEPFGIKVALIEPSQVSTTFASKSQKLPDEGSPYLERAKRFLARDGELIKAAPTPPMAGKVFADVILAEKPKLFNQIDAQSRFFFFLNKHLPTGIRDGILVNHMDIKVPKTLAR